MSYATGFIIAVGIAISSAAGAVCCLGAGFARTRLDWLPLSEPVLSYPELSLAFGVSLFFVGVLTHPRSALS